jgi:hypothetical protein
VTPCATCPWRRSATPGALGSSEPATTFIGQAFGPFRLPCHETYDSSAPGWKAEANRSPECRGAAIFRANVGLTDRLPRALLSLPPNDVLVFTGPEEFLAHHERITISRAVRLLANVPPGALARMQMARCDNVILAHKRGA